MHSPKYLFMTFILIMLVFGLSGCYLSIDSYELDINDITQIEIISINEANRDEDEVLYTSSDLTNEDQIVSDIYALSNTHTYNHWLDYRNQKNRATLEELDQVIVFIYTDSMTYRIGLALMSYPHLDHYHYEEKAVLLDQDLRPLEVIDNTFYTELLNLFEIT